MRFEGTQPINAPIEKVWAFVMDPDKVAGCAPGFVSMEKLGPDHFKPTLGVGVGAVKMNFTLDVTLVDLQQPTHAGVRGHGVAVGSAVDIDSAMDLVAESDTLTRMNWMANVNVSGKIASMGARLLEGVAHKLTERFFTCMRQQVEVPAASSATPSTPSAGA
jgi:carbon monoxide dehydrogenase subunit G